MTRTIRLMSKAFIGTAKPSELEELSNRLFGWLLKAKPPVITKPEPIWPHHHNQEWFLQQFYELAKEVYFDDEDDDELNLKQVRYCVKATYNEILQLYTNVKSNNGNYVTLEIVLELLGAAYGINYLGDRHPDFDAKEIAEVLLYANRNEPLELV